VATTASNPDRIRVLTEQLKLAQRAHAYWQARKVAEQVNPAPLAGAGQTPPDPQVGKASSRLVRKQDLSLQQVLDNLSRRPS